MAKLADFSSISGFKSELELFGLPPRDVSLKKGHWAEYYHQNPITDTDPYRFIIPRDKYMLDLNKNYIYMKLRIEKPDGNPLEKADQLFPINALGGAVFSRLVVRIRDKEIYNSEPYYAYQACLELLLNYGWDAKNSHTRKMLYRKDLAGSFNDLASVVARERVGHFKKNVGVELIGRDVAL